MPKLPTSNKRPWIPKKKRTRQHDNSKFYHSMRWRNLRRYIIKKYPLCVMCERKGEVNPAYVVDHIKPISMGGSPTDESNLQTLCRKCHDKKSAQEGVEYRKGIKKYER